jgi:hypothetical protein
VTAAAARHVLEERMRRKPSDLNRDTMLGGGVGMLSGATFAVALGADVGMVAFGGTLGLFSGLVAGVLIWLETADLPEDRIPPVRHDRRR